MTCILCLLRNCLAFDCNYGKAGAAESGSGKGCGPDWQTRRARGTGKECLWDVMS